MTLEKTIRKNLSNWRPEERDQLTVKATDNQWTVELTADKCDELGCQVWELAVRRALDGADDSVQCWSERLTKCTGLGEKLCVVEVDTVGNQAVLRSESPTEDDGTTEYFELFIHSAQLAVLRRYQVIRNQKRMQVSFVLTHQSIAAVVQSMTC